VDVSATRAEKVGELGPPGSYGIGHRGPHGEKSTARLIVQTTTSDTTRHRLKIEVYLDPGPVSPCAAEVLPGDMPRVVSVDRSGTSFAFEDRAAHVKAIT